ncbi:MAG: metallophosphatase domain-containing protein [Bacteroidales bacterium]|nr:metallophosphatase domain-containing protein [Bacteroidales bacterium]
MKIIHISDTHGKHRELAPLPDGDVLVHSGDFSFAGSDNEALDFLDWLCDQPHKHKIFVAGNHDVAMWDANIEGLPPNVHFLSDSGVSIEGKLFYGAPMQMGMKNGKLSVVENYDLIPEGVDVLITHQPPMGILDLDSAGRHFGSTKLLEKVTELKPKLHLFGHVHNAYGTNVWKDIAFVNGSVVNDHYSLMAERPTQVIEI